MAAEAVGSNRFIGPAMVVAGLLLVAGWTLPLMTVKQFIFLSERVSVFGAVRDLWRADQFLLVLIVAVFSVVFPIVKLGLAFYIWYAADAAGGRLHRLLGSLSALAKWSMLDVFVVALVVVAIQLSLVGDVLLNPGLYLFVAAVLLSMLVVRRVAAAAAARPAD